MWRERPSGQFFLSAAERPAARSKSFVPPDGGPTSAKTLANEARIRTHRVPVVRRVEEELPRRHGRHADEHDHDELVPLAQAGVEEEAEEAAEEDDTECEQVGRAVHP